MTGEALCKEWGINCRSSAGRLMGEEGQVSDKTAATLDGGALAQDAGTGDSLAYTYGL